MFRLGDVVETPSGNRATVYLWDTKVDWPITAPPGSVYSRVEVKLCLGAGSEPRPVSDLAYLFTLQMPNDTRISTENSGYNGDELLGHQEDFAPGECARGLIIYKTPAGQRPKYVLLSLVGGGNVKWRV